MENLHITILSESQVQRESLAEDLRKKNYSVSIARNTKEGFERIYDDPPDVILVDLISIVREGPKIYRHFKTHRRTRQCYIIFVASENIIRSFDFAQEFDDFVLAPVSVTEIDARIRKASRNFGLVPGQNIIKINGLVIDCNSIEVTINGNPIKLTHKEFELLRFLALNRRRAFTRDQLLTHVWNYDNYSVTRTVDMHIRRLRKKLGSFAGHIETLPSIGYKLV